MKLVVAALHEIAHGPFRTCQARLAMSAPEGRADLAATLAQVRL
jgi:hypothetical protein